MFFLLYNRLSITYLLSDFLRIPHVAVVPDPNWFPGAESGPDSRGVFCISE